jgi:hypothetical protein
MPIKEDFQIAQIWSSLCAKEDDPVEQEMRQGTKSGTEFVSGSGWSCKEGTASLMPEVEECLWASALVAFNEFTLSRYRVSSTPAVFSCFICLFHIFQRKRLP